MKILIIYPKYKDAITGGQIYDHYLIDRIKNNRNVTVEMLTDEKLGNTNRYLYNFYYLKYLICNHNYDIILTNSTLYKRLFLPFIYLRCIHSKISLISLHHAFTFLVGKDINKRICKILELSFLKLCHKIIIPAPYMRHLMKKFLPHKKIIYMSLAFKEEREKNRSSLDQNRILFVGRIEPLKGIKYLLEALDALHKEQIPFTCDIVGIIEDENYYQDLLSFINERKMQDIIAFKGHIFDKTELNSYYQRSSCFVFPSLHEGFGMVLIEAMSFGLPVVAFNNSAMPYTIKHGINGFLAENQNSMDLKEYVKSVLLDKNLRETMGAEAIKTYLQSKTFKELDQEIDILCQTNFTSVVL